VKPTSNNDDRRLRAQLAIEAAIAEALRRREVVRMLAFALFAALVIAAVFLFAALP
jgi:hypothetical protein